MKIFQKIRGWGSRPGSILVLVLGAFLGAMAFASMGSFMVYANSEQFCATACHEMAPPVGVRATHSDQRGPVDFTETRCRIKRGRFSKLCQKR